MLAACSSVAFRGPQRAEAQPEHCHSAWHHARLIDLWAVGSFGDVPSGLAALPQCGWLGCTATVLGCTATVAALAALPQCGCHSASTWRLSEALTAMRLSKHHYVAWRCAS